MGSKIHAEGEIEARFDFEAPAPEAGSFVIQQSYSAHLRRRWTGSTSVSAHFPCAIGSLPYHANCPVKRLQVTTGALISVTVSEICSTSTCTVRHGTAKPT